MSLLPARGSSPFATIIGAIRTRILTNLTSNDPGGVVSSNYVRLCTAPDPDWADFKAEEGVALIVHPPQPFQRAGAGRHGYLTVRQLTVIVSTQSLLDTAGESDIAVAAHLSLEERVADVIMDGNRTTPAQAVIPGATTVKWVPGGDEIRRKLKVDPGLYTSVLVFHVEYVPPLTVNRD